MVQLQQPFDSPFVTVCVVPTGIAASIGGYAGDAMPCARLLANATDILITNPNVLNAAMLYPPQNAWDNASSVMYVEGMALDLFATGRWALAPLNRRTNKVGLVLDAAIEPELRTRHVQVAQAMRASVGADIVTEAVVTSSPLGVKLGGGYEKYEQQNTTACSSRGGGVTNTEALLEACEIVVSKHGCDAVAVVTRFPDDVDDGAYRHGDGVDPVGGAEAAISHAVVSSLGVPCAHAPCNAPWEVDDDVHPKAAAEELGYTFLPCVLSNLHFLAPRYVALKNDHDLSSDFENPSHAALMARPGEGFNAAAYMSALDQPPRPSSMPPMPEKMPTPGGYETLLTAAHVNAVVVPATACGSPAVLALCGNSTAALQARRGQPPALCICVESNTTVMDVTPELLDLPNAIRVRSYAEAAGILLAQRAGVVLDSLM